MRDMTARIIVRLQDRFSSGISALQRRLDGVSRAMRGIGAIAGIGAALSLAGPIQQAAAFDQALRDIAITAGRTGAEVGQMVRELEGQFNRLAIENGQRASAIAQGAGVLIAAGMDRALVDRLMPTIARVATATNASIQEIAQTAFALSDTLRVGPEGMERALAALVQAGKEGRFELRDMAREFPGLTAAAAALGLTGQNAVNSLAAALQVARRGAATSTEAANNLQNFLQKLTAPETVRNFRAMGVNLEEVMADAARRGINPIEAVIQKVRELTGGNMFRVGELFGDAQVLNFLRPMMQNVDEYLRIREAANAAGPALIGQDFAAQMEGPFRQLEVFYERLSQLGTRLGRSLSRGLAPINEVLGRIVGFVEALEEANPGLLDAVVTIVAAVGGLGLLAGGASLVLGALAPLAAFMAGPFGVALALIAGAAVLIYTRWGDIVAVWRRVQAAWDRFANSEQVRWLREVLGGAIAWVADRVGDLAAGFAGLGDRISSAFATVMSALRPVMDAIQWVIDRLPSLPSLRTGGGSGPLAPQGQGLRRPGVASGFYPPEAANDAGRDTRVGGEIVVRAAPGTEVVDTRSRNPDVPIVPNRGAIVGVP